MSDEQLLLALSRKSVKMRRAMAKDRGLVELVLKRARVRIDPKWIKLKEDDPRKKENFKFACEMIRGDILKERPEAKSILGSILLGVVINLIVKAIMGMIT